MSVRDLDTRKKPTVTGTIDWNRVFLRAARERIARNVRALMMIGAFGLAAFVALGATTLENAVAQSMITAFATAADAGTAAVVEIHTSGEAAKLATLTCPSSIGSVSDGNPGGLLTVGSITSDSSADGTGTAAVYVLLTQTGGTRICAGTVSTSGADINFDTVSFVAAATIAITSLTFTMPESA